MRPGVFENRQFKSKKITFFFPVKDEIPHFSKLKISLTEISTARQISGLNFKIAVKLTEKIAQFSSTKKHTVLSS